MKTNAELKQLAVDMRAGRIFTSAQIENPANNLKSAFMVLALMDQKQLDDLKAEKPGLFFEYMDKAAPRSVNGYPCFFSFSILTIPETKKFWRYVKKLEQAEEAVK